MKKVLFTLLAAILTLTGSIAAQPRLVIAVTGGYNLPLPPLKGTIDSVNSELGESYFVKTGYNLGLSGKYALDKKGRVRVTFGGSYNKFSGEETYSHTNDVRLHTTMGIISANLGAEYSFTPREKTAPFVGLDLTGNFFSGKSEETVTIPTTADHNDPGTTTTNLKSASRFGLAVGGGVDVAFNKSIGAVFGAKYHFANLIGKEYIATSSAGEYNLNDKENGSLKAKNIMYFQLYLGVTFYFNQQKKPRY
ncbi:MAG: outer membrane beta-barrel protein [Ignavibacteria bacterium]|nr:outer membrane beta-barrel protein [Ignavibacteria bacterium]